MTRFGSMTSIQHIGSRLVRLPLVVLLAIGLLVSLLHCADNAFSYASTDAAAVTMTTGQGSTPDLPEHLSPCHSGHCLSHATAQPVTVTLGPADHAARGPAFGRAQFPASIAGLPLFKPPRA
jgi:hypothetical protein